MGLIDTAKWNNVHSDPCDVSSLETRSYEEILEEESEIQKVVLFLERYGIKVKSEYGYFRDTYDILKDISNHYIFKNLFKEEN